MGGLFFPPCRRPIVSHPSPLFLRKKGLFIYFFYKALVGLGLRWPVMDNLHFRHIRNEIYVNALPVTDYYGIHEENVRYLTDWFGTLIKSIATWDLCFVRLCNRWENLVALPGKINRSLTVISWSTAPRHSRQMFQPSGIWILTTRVQATCNLESVVITAMQLPLKGHHLRHYNSKAIVHRPQDPEKTKWTDGRRRRKWKTKKTSILRVGAKCACSRRPPKECPLTSRCDVRIRMTAT